MLAGFRGRFAVGHRVVALKKCRIVRELTTCWTPATTSWPPAAPSGSRRSLLQFGTSNRRVDQWPALRPALSGQLPQSGSKYDLNLSHGRLTEGLGRRNENYGAWRGRDTAGGQRPSTCRKKVTRSRSSTTSPGASGTTSWASRRSPPSRPLLIDFASGRNSPDSTSNSIPAISATTSSSRRSSRKNAPRPWCTSRPDRHIEFHAAHQLAEQRQRSQPARGSLPRGRQFVGDVPWRPGAEAPRGRTCQGLKPLASKEHPGQGVCVSRIA